MQCSYGKLITTQTCVPSACGFSLPAFALPGNCSTPTNPLVPLSSLPSGQMCMIKCTAGYHLEGDSFFSCWFGAMALTQKCVPDSCVITAPINGTLGLCPGMLPSGQSCQLGCGQGYKLEGTATSCVTGSLTSQSCGGRPCFVSAPDNGGLGTCPTQLTSGSTCSFNCSDGYQINGGATSSCLDGRMAGQTCVPAPCALDQPVNGLYYYVRDSSTRNRMRNCFRPFVLLTVLCILSARGGRFCCLPVLLSVLPPPRLQPNAPQSTRCSSVMQHGVSCQIGCLPGFFVNGTSTLCQYGKISSQQLCSPAPCKVTVPSTGRLGSCPKDLSRWKWWKLYSGVHEWLPSRGRQLSAVLVWNDVTHPNLCS
jgi:hypothetical protein